MPIYPHILLWRNWMTRIEEAKAKFTMTLAVKSVLSACLCVCAPVCMYSVSVNLIVQTNQFRNHNYHVCSINWSGHLDLPEILAVSHDLGATDSSCAAAVVDMKPNFAFILRQFCCRWLVCLIPRPLKHYNNHRNEVQTIASVIKHDFNKL